MEAELAASGITRAKAVAGLAAPADTEATRQISAPLAYAQAAGDLALIHGPSGRGKTWAAKCHCRSRADAVLKSAHRRRSPRCPAFCHALAWRPGPGPATVRPLARQAPSSPGWRVAARW